MAKSRMSFRMKPGGQLLRERHLQRGGMVQKYIDAEVLRRSVPYIPMLSGVLYKSGTLGTVIGSGVVRYTAPYARYQYYGKLMVSSKTGSTYAASGEKKILTATDLVYGTSRHPKAGKLWFERVKADHKEAILKGARAVANRG